VAVKVSSNALLRLLSVGGMLFCWFFATGFEGYTKPIWTPVFLPSPVTVVTTLWTLLDSGYQGQSLYHHLGVSLRRFGISMAFSLLVGVPIGLAMGMNERFRSLLDPPIELTRPIPKLAILPLLIIWFGIGELSKIAIIVFTIFPITTISAMQAVRAVSRRKIQAAYSLGASSWQVFWHVLLPGSLPGIFTSIRVSVGLGVTMLVGAEMIATSDGIAWMALNASEFLLSNVVLVAITIMAFVGVILDLLIRKIEGAVIHWTGKEG
jgi:taurine transport system permease protein